MTDVHECCNCGEASNDSYPITEKRKKKWRCRVCHERAIRHSHSWIEDEVCLGRPAYIRGKNDHLLKWSLLLLLLPSTLFAQVQVPGISNIVAPKVGEKVTVTEFVDHSKAKITRIRRYDGVTGELLYDSNGQITAEKYHKLAAAGYWSWTKRKPHHAAVCIVRNAGSQGTGCLIWKNSSSTWGCVATAAHVLARGQGTIKWQSGETSTCQAVAADGEADGSLLWVKNVPKGIKPIAVSRETPKAGDFVEHCGFGGPGSNLRHFWATWRGGAPSGVRRNLTNCYLLNGDSGGPVLYKGKLIGMNSGGYNTRNVGIGAGSGSSWPLHSPAIIAGPVCLRGMVNSLMGRTEAKTCELFQRVQQWGPQIFGGRRSQPPRGRSPQYFPQPQPDPQGSPDGFDPYVPTPPGGEQGPPPPADPAEDEECRKRVGEVESGLAEAKTQLSKVEELGAANSQRLDEIGSSLAAIKEQLNSMQANLQVNVQVNQDLANIVNNNSTDIADLREKIQAILEKQQEPAKPPTTDPAPKDRSADLILYYTSRSCTECKNVDAKIDALKNRGWPIVVTRLSPTDARTQGVPRIYVPSKDKHVVGISNCMQYLTSLIR